MAAKRPGGKKLLYALVLIVLALGLAYALGPRPPVDTTIEFDAARLPEDLDRWLEESEEKVPDLRPHDRKQIVWAYPASRARTPLAIVYVHGFSAGPAEIRPVPDRVARELGANLFFTRLTGHGRNGDAMLAGSVKAWANDLAEAVAMGRRLGDRVIVIATSTGATLATWGMSEPEIARDVAGISMISPNYGVQAAGGSLLKGPWASSLIRLVVGERRGFEPRSPAHAAHWTTDYPAQALVALGGLLRLADRVDVSRIAIPALFIYSPADRVVNQDLTRGVVNRWGGPKEVLEIDKSGDRENHVIAGDALSPETTDLVAARIVGWAKGL
jgi:hypothetical protein